jgi:hypothetical protein
MPTSGAVRASVSVEDISRQYYETAGMSMWITQMHVDPLELIVADDSSGKLYRVPVQMGRGGTFEFGEAQEVAIEYKDVKTPAGSKAAASMPFRWQTREAAFAAAGVQERTEVETTVAHATEEPHVERALPPSEAIKKVAAATATKTPDATPAAGQPHKTEEASGMAIDAAKIREALGLSADAPLSDEAKAELLTALGLSDPAPAPTGATDPAALLAAIPQGAEPIVLDRSSYGELLKRADLGVQAFEEMKRGKRDSFLDQACRDGRFPVSKLGDYRAMWDKNPDATRDFVMLMPRNSVPTMASGLFGVEQALNEADAAYDAYMKGGVQ